MMCVYKKIVLFLSCYICFCFIYSQDLICDNILDQLINSNKYKTFFKSDKSRAYLQEVFILNYLFPWMNNHNGRFPRLKDFGKNPNKINFPLYRLFHSRVEGRKYCGLFDSREDLISKAIVKAKEKNLYHLYSFPRIDVNSKLKNNPHIRYINSIQQKDLQDPIKREEIQRYFIENIIFPWMIDHNGALPTNLDYKKTILGVSYSKVFGTKHPQNDSFSTIGIFDSMLDLKKKVISLDKDHRFKIVLNIKTDKPVDDEHTKYIYSVTQQDLKDPQKREQIQKYFIENILFPWIINHNGQYPQSTDFKRSRLGVSFSKLFGYTNYNNNRENIYIGIFDNSMDLKNKALAMSMEHPSISIRPESDRKLLFSVDLDNIDFNNSYTMYRYRMKFIKIFILPWIKTHKKFPTEDDFGFHKTQIYISYEKIFGSKDKDMGQDQPLFESIEELKSFMLLLIKRSKISPIYQQYISLCSDYFIGND